MAAPAADEARAAHATTRATTPFVSRAVESILPAAASARLATPLARPGEAFVPRAAATTRSTPALT
jgi:hypothetical protein